MKSTKDLFFTAAFLIVLIASLPLVSAYSLTYDANGNLVTGDGKYREYNGFNKLVRVRDGNNATGNLLEEYMWEADKDKVLVKHVYENNTWKESVYYPSQTFLMVKNASGTFKYKYIYQNGQLVAFENYDGKKFFVLGDHKGSASVITNESGAKVEETFYEPFGKVISGGAVSRFSYEGKELSSVLGDYDFHARRYDPDLYVFEQPDSVIQDIYDPQTLNHYSFERNNPYKYKDETGNTIEIFQDTLNTVLQAISIGMASITSVISVPVVLITAGIAATVYTGSQLYTESEELAATFEYEYAYAQKGRDFFEMVHDMQTQLEEYEKVKQIAEITKGDLRNEEIDPWGVSVEFDPSGFISSYPLPFSLEPAAKNIPNGGGSSSRTSSSYTYSSNNGYTYKESSNSQSTTYTAEKKTSGGYTWTSVTVTKVIKAPSNYRPRTNRLS